MNRQRIGLRIMVILVALGLLAKCFATERVVKMASLCGNGMGCPVKTIANSYGPFVGTVDASVLDGHTFTVYTTAEVDGQIQSLQKTVSNDDAQIEILRKNIKALSDANDALTKRLNEMEKALNDHHSM